MIPHERSLVTKFAGKPFVIIGVNSDKNLAAVKPKFVQEKITWRSFWCGEDGGGGPIPTAWNIAGWPTLVMIDAKGVIRQRWLGSPDRVEDIDDLIATCIGEGEGADKPGK
jgi:hypothetical protein